jgi:uncharacterized membrane protein YhaH (DUF805 family)
MKGNVIGFDPDTNTGAISGHDGNRYDFATVDWHGQRQPRHGDVVDFQPEGQRATQIYVTEAQYVEPGVAQLYFSPIGRMSRSQYWLKWFLPVFAILFVLLILLAATRETAISVLFIGIVVIFYFALLWSQIAVSIKRVHDRDWPWPFILLLFVPLVQFWPMIEIMFLPGTVGGNRFGPDPVTRR